MPPWWRKRRCGRQSAPPGQELLQAVEVFRLSDSEVHHGASSASVAFAAVPAQPPSVGSRGRVLGLGLRKKTAAMAVATDVF
jgi:hypothetical protein